MYFPSSLHLNSVTTSLTYNPRLPGALQLKFLLCGKNFFSFCYESAFCWFVLMTLLLYWRVNSLCPVALSRPLIILYTPLYIPLSVDCCPVHFEAYLIIQNLLRIFDHVSHTSLNLNSTVPYLTWETRSADRMWANYGYRYSSGKRGLLSCVYHFILNTCQKLQLASKAL